MTEYLVYSIGGFIIGLIYKHTLEELYKELTRKEEEADDILDEMIQEVEHLKPCDECKTKADDLEMYKKDTMIRLNGLKKELDELEKENINLLKEGGESWFSVLQGG